MQCNPRQSTRHTHGAVGPLQHRATRGRRAVQSRLSALCNTVQPEGLCLCNTVPVEGPLPSATPCTGKAAGCPGSGGNTVPLEAPLCNNVQLEDPLPSATSINWKAAGCLVPQLLQHRTPGRRRAVQAQEATRHIPGAVPLPLQHRATRGRRAMAEPSLCPLQHQAARGPSALCNTAQLEGGGLSRAIPL